jgi:uncharacterized protein YecE (DUF72 family)
MAPAAIRVGCAGWTLPVAVQPQFGGHGRHLERYATRLNACEINSSFHRPHSASTYARWAASVPAGFLFSVKLPKTMTHERRLAGCEGLLDEFMAQAPGLGAKLGCLLVQLPPSVAFDPDTAGGFLAALQQRCPAPVALEPRHASWFGADVDAWLAQRRVARVLADPVRHPRGERPGGWPGLVYLRLHGSPRVYYSAYDDAVLQALAARMRQAAQEGCPVWCMFDNTAGQAAAGNALALAQRLGLAQT